MKPIGSMKMRLFLLLMTAINVNSLPVNAESLRPPSACDEISGASLEELADCVSAEITLEQIDALQGIVSSSPPAGAPKALPAPGLAVPQPGIAEQQQAQLNQLYDEYRSLERQIPGAYYHARPTH